MDLLLSDFKKEYPKAIITQAKNVFYKQYHHRLKLMLPTRGYTNRNIQRNLYHRIDDDYRIRLEAKQLTIFFNSQTVFNEIIQALKKIFVDVNQTADKYIIELTVDQIGLEKQSIHIPAIKKKGYNYKVTISTGWKKFSPAMKQKLLNLYNNDPENYKITPMTYKWLNSPELVSNWTGKYFYVRDQKMITFIQLSCSDIIDQVYEII